MKKIFKTLKTLLFLAISFYCLYASWMSFNSSYLLAITNFILFAVFLFFTIDSIFGKDYEKIQIVYHSNIEKLKRINEGDWIDLRSAENIELKKGEFKLISLGVSMKLPKGYEAHIVPRSSTYKNFKIIQTNHQGVIDQSYCGTNDVWKYPALAMEDTVIHKGDRICQFRIVRNQPEVHFIETDKLDDVDRGGFGTTGTK